VPFVEQNYGLHLDYGVPSLGQIDGILDDLRRDQRFETIQPILFSLGCYVGEVIVRNAKARWRTPESLGLTAMASSPIVLEMADGRSCNPVGKVYRRFEHGSADDLAVFYRSIAEPPRGAP